MCHQKFLHGLEKMLVSTNSEDMLGVKWGFSKINSPPPVSINIYTEKMSEQVIGEIGPANRQGLFRNDAIPGKGSAHRCGRDYDRGGSVSFTEPIIDSIRGTYIM